MRFRKLTDSFDVVFGSEGVRILRMPVRAPQANALTERWAGTVRRELLDRLLIVGRWQLETLLAAYVAAARSARARASAAPGSGRLTPPRLIR